MQIMENWARLILALTNHEGRHMRNTHSDLTIVVGAFLGFAVAFLLLYV